MAKQYQIFRPIQELLEFIFHSKKIKLELAGDQLVFIKIKSIWPAPTQFGTGLYFCFIFVLAGCPYWIIEATLNWKGI